MEGKSLLFKYLGGVDAVPLCVATKSADELIGLVKALEPSFGGINLEDIAQPKCFRVLDALRAEMNIPVWHDDQQGTAMVVLAGLTNALRVVGKELGSVRIALIGVGAANVATYRLLKASGITPVAVVACDRRGVLHAEREDLGWKYEVDGREFLTAECAFQVGCLFWVDMLVLLPLGIWFASSMIAWS